VLVPVDVIVLSELIRGDLLIEGDTLELGVVNGLLLKELNTLELGVVNGLLLKKADPLAVLDAAVVKDAHIGFILNLYVVCP